MRKDTGLILIIYRVSVSTVSETVYPNMYASFKKDDIGRLPTQAEFNGIMKDAISEIFHDDDNFEIVSSRVIRTDGGCIEFIGELLLKCTNWLISEFAPDFVEKLLEGKKDEAVLDLSMQSVKQLTVEYAKRCDALRTLLCNRFSRAFYKTYDRCVYKVKSRFGVCDFDTFVRECDRSRPK